MLSTMTSVDTDDNAVINTRLVTVKKTNANDAISWTSPISTTAACTRLSTMAPSFRQRGHGRLVLQQSALHVSNFSSNANEWHRENFVIRLPPQSSNADDSYNSESIWWWDSSMKTTHSAFEPPRDRILQQMSYMPLSYSRRRLRGSNATSVKVIYVPGEGTKKGRDNDKFVGGQCLVDACTISTDPRDASTSDMRLLYGESSLFQPSQRLKPPGQIWVIYLLESPTSTGEFHNFYDLINWTATFRWDSTIVTPYAKFVPRSARQNTSPKSMSLNEHSYTDPASLSTKLPTVINYAAGKTKMVAWFVSNCFSRNERGAYVEELSRHLPVDVFGVCGKPSCRRLDDSCWLRLRREYKFYLAFENSNCDYYITEKFFDNALR